MCPCVPYTSHRRSDERLYGICQHDQKCRAECVRNISREHAADPRISPSSRRLAASAQCHEMRPVADNQDRRRPSASAHDTRKLCAIEHASYRSNDSYNRHLGSSNNITSSNGSSVDFTRQVPAKWRRNIMAASATPCGKSIDSNIDDSNVSSPSSSAGFIVISVCRRAHGNDSMVSPPGCLLVAICMRVVVQVRFHAYNDTIRKMVFCCREMHSDYNKRRNEEKKYRARFW